MGQQNDTQSSTKPRRSRKTYTANQENDKQASIRQRPTNEDREAWKAYWQARGQLWRTEPEIDGEGQKYLAERRSIIPDIEKGIYPFKDIKLSRADIEWLLAAHENGRGPIDRSDLIQRKRRGLDLRGANLRDVNLSNLPLSGLQGGLNVFEETNATIRQIREAAAAFDWSNLHSTLLEDASLSGATFWRADLRGAHLFGAHLEYADLRSAFFDETSTLRKATLSIPKHKFAQVADVRWGGVNLAVVNWPRTKRKYTLILADDHFARQKNTMKNPMKDEGLEIYEYERAVRANRQLANALQEQGLNELAVHFAYRAQMLQRKVFRLQGLQKIGHYLFSLFIDLLSGYGYKPWRSFLAYILAIAIF